jgi:hypothetical protein
VVDVIGVDPRDETWGVDQPAYRVYFHDERGASDEYEVRGADVEAVIAWAEAHRDRRTYVLYACAPLDGVGLLRLAGRDPYAADAAPRPRSPRASSGPPASPGGQGHRPAADRR